MNMQASIMDIPDLSTAPLTSPTRKFEGTAYPNAKDALSNGLFRLRTDHSQGVNGSKLRDSQHSPLETWWDMNASITSAIVKALDRKRLGVVDLDEGEVQDRYGERGERRSSVLTSDEGWEAGMVDGDWDGERGIQVTTENKENSSGGLHVQLKMMQSRPLCDGVKLARDLVHGAQAVEAAHRLHNYIASDASVAILEPDVDVVMIEADRINI
ncbi:hypothetical protein PAAG_04307 [Paracoccidioides lutzii Pb01]|uniref:Uncharacterized protein n=1 Tax=Paracoccidioides lutzii (strain ATCC MYA-826 / Pb01) TaxID=502779 RepID=C1H0L3_PARBA|nr:hypothetical protein PAAG_04307 [Paracoccidioides lutzii Pb01]EEH33254.2 hypothetical protein PAAG_04307 [Paracoccidioides lutzii Pb01]